MSNRVLLLRQDALFSMKLANFGQLANFASVCLSSNE